MANPDKLRYTRIPLNNGSGAIPAVGFGTLIPDPTATRQATKTALEVGFRHFDCAERYRNEEAVGEAMQEAFGGGIRREDVFVTTKLWNTNHRPERVKPAFDASRRRLQIDYVDCYIIHTPFAFHPGDEQDPRDERGHVIYDSGVTLVDTWRALERLVDEGQCKSSPIPISLSGTCWTFAGSTGSSSWRSQRWDTPPNQNFWTTPLLRPSRGALAKRLLRLGSPGPHSAARLS